MNIDGVSTGIVLDHIKAGKSMRFTELLKLEKLNNCVADHSERRQLKIRQKGHHQNRPAHRPGSGRPRVHRQQYHRQYRQRRKTL